MCAARTAPTSRSTSYAEAMPGVVASAVQAARVRSGTWLAASRATRVPRTVTTCGEYAWAASAPIPITGTPVLRIAASVSSRPVRP